MAPIEICRDGKTPASAITEDITAFLPDGKQIELYSTEEGFETDTPVNSKTEFRNGEVLPLRGGLVARAVEEKEGIPSEIEIVKEESQLEIDCGSWPISDIENVARRLGIKSASLVKPANVNVVKGK